MDFYMAVIRNNLGWKVKDFKGMSFEEVEAKFKTVWKQMEDFIPMGSKEKGEMIKRKGLNLKQESAKKQKTSEEVPKEAMSLEEVTEEKVYTEGQMSYWKITRLGGSSSSYQFFIDLLKHLDREDLNQLWRMVKEIFSNRPPTSEKEMELWVELNKIFMTCEVHHVTSKDKEIFMLLEKDYPLRKGLALVMICYKLQVENFSHMANDLVLKIYKIRNMALLEEKRSHCQKDRTAINVKKKLPVKGGSYAKVVITLEDPIINIVQQSSTLFFMLLMVVYEILLFLVLPEGYDLLALVELSIHVEGTQLEDKSWPLIQICVTLDHGHSHPITSVLLGFTLYWVEGLVEVEEKSFPLVKVVGSDIVSPWGWEGLTLKVQVGLKFKQFGKITP
nr:hypothetical protein [Tanacetum cinerariifolium]